MLELALGSVPEKGFKKRSNLRMLELNRTLGLGKILTFQPNVFAPHHTHTHTHTHIHTHIHTHTMLQISVRPELLTPTASRHRHYSTSPRPPLTQATLSYSLLNYSPHLNGLLSCLLHNFIFL